LSDKQLPGEVLTHVPQMSLRDWFAGQCLIGEVTWHGLEGIDARIVAECAYELADAMLAQRIKP